MWFETDDYHKAQEKLVRANRRERIAAAVLGHILAGPNRIAFDGVPISSDEEFVGAALRFADALIEKLDKTQA